jgi:nitronate monooxygenase
MTSPNVPELLRRPVVVAPMAGGPSTVALAIAAAEAGAFTFLAAGYKSVEAMVAEMAEVRAGRAEPFGVNVFVPGAPANDLDALATYLDTLAADAEAVDAALGEPTWDDDQFDAKISALLADPPSAVSFTFGCPSPDVVAAFRDAGCAVAVTVTQPSEAAIAARAGTDALCVQGHEAGAHRGVFTNDGAAASDLDLLSLIAKIAEVTDLPQIAAGGIVQREQVSAVLAAGAVAAQCGTAFLRCTESGAHPAYKAALIDPHFTNTVVTRAFSGRPARGLVNRFIVDHADPPCAYPEINNATRPLRAAAAAHGDVDKMSLWAGVGFRSATDDSAGEVVERLCAPLSGTEL